MTEPTPESGRHAAAEPILELDHVVMRFGGVVALRDANITVNKGEIFALIGPNGAGKTTVFNVVTGVFRPSEGQIRFAGNRIDGMKRFKVTKTGIAADVPEHPAVPQHDRGRRT
jgi:branched-chain amino acid transport system ATP-binding protein